MKEFICANGNVVRLHDGELVKDGKFTQAGIAVAKDAMKRFYKAVMAQKAEGCKA